jgi:hypothetical protein
LQNRGTAEIAVLNSAFCVPNGGVAQLGERLLCKQEVDGSIPFTSTIDHQMTQLTGRKRGGKRRFCRAEKADLEGGPSERRFADGQL